VFVQNFSVPSSSVIFVSTFMTHEISQIAEATTVANQRRCSAVDAYPRPHLESRRVTFLTGKTVVRILVENKRAVGVELMDKGLEAIMAGEVVLSASTVHSRRS
jgi:choline dehydrogenase-like flavoprotein